MSTSSSNNNRNNNNTSRGQRAAYWATKVASTAKEVAKGVSAVGQVASSVAAIVRILNSKEWYTHTGSITPAVNINRPMNPGSIEYMENNVTVASVPPIVRTVFSWTGWENSNAINLAVHKMYKDIRGLLKSNLPYKEEDVKAVIVNSIYFYAYGKQLEKSMGWALYVTKDVPQFQEMHRSDVMTFVTGNVLSHSDEKLPWFSSVERYTQAIADIPVFNSFAAECLLPSRLMDMVAHYFGSYFTDQTDQYSIQYYDNWMLDLPFTQTGVDDNTKVWQPMSLIRHPSEVLADLRSFLNTYGMVIADMQKKLDLKSPRFIVQGEYAPYLIDDPTYFQALINAYTSDEAELDATNYFRLDLMEQGLSDDLTPYLFIGALQKQVASTQNAPLFRTIVQYTLWYNELGTVYPIALMEGYPLNGLVTDPTYEITAPKGVNAVVVDSFINSTTNITVGSRAETGVVSPSNPVSSFPQGGFNIEWNSFDILPTQEPRKLIPVLSEATPIESVNMGFVIMGKVQFLGTQGGIPTHYLVAYGDVTPTVFPDGGFKLITPLYTKLAIISELYISGIDRAYEYAQNYVSHPIPLFLINSSLIPTIIDLAISSDDNFVYTGYQFAAWPRPANTIPLGYALGVLNGYVLNNNMGDTRFYLDPSTISGATDWRGAYVVGAYNSPWFVPSGDTSAASRSRIAIAIPSRSISLPVWGEEITIELRDYIVSTQSVTYSATLSGTTPPSLQVTVPSSNILAWYTSVVDKHIPIVVKHSVYVTYEGTLTTHHLGRDLLKETYIPYLYNILDLNPVTYNMTVSLLSVEGRKSDRRDFTKKTK